MGLDELRRAEQTLLNALGPNIGNIQDILDDINREINDKRFLIELPDASHLDLPMDELSSLVARSSNAYGRIARFSGIAHAEYKIAMARYERTYRQNRGDGRNDDERRANAMVAAEEEHIAMTIAEAMSAFATEMTFGARIASESARKVYDRAVEMWVAQRREDRGSFTDRDFT